MIDALVYEFQKYIGIVNRIGLTKSVVLMLCNTADFTETQADRGSFIIEITIS